MLKIILLVIFRLSLVEFSQALISCDKTNVANTQLCLMNENNSDIRTYPDITKVGDPLKIKTTITLISIAEVCLLKIIQKI